MGRHWPRAFRRFDVNPVAAASIGQVHRAMLRDGREVAVKVQYPGVARSIDSDIANVGALLRLSGLVPKGVDLTPYLDEARGSCTRKPITCARAATLPRSGSAYPRRIASWCRNTTATGAPRAC